MHDNSRGSYKYKMKGADKQRFKRIWKNTCKIEAKFVLESQS